MHELTAQKAFLPSFCEQHVPRIPHILMRCATSPLAFRAVFF